MPLKHSQLHVEVVVRAWHKVCVCMMCMYVCVCRWYELVLAAEDDIATIMTMEGGKPLKESKGEFAAG